MKVMWAILLGSWLYFGFSIAACGGDDSSDDSTDQGSGSKDKPSNHGDASTKSDAENQIPNGEFCHLLDNCASGFCESWRQAPADQDAVCSDGPASDQIRLMATTVDFQTRQPVTEVEVAVVSAIAASTLGKNAVSLESATSDGDGRYDITLDKASLEDPLGIVVLSEKEGYYDTSTGLSEPDEESGEYPSGTDEHDTLLVTTALLEKWSALIAADTQLAAYGPLGDQGGVIGSIVSRSKGTGIENAEIVSQKGDSSSAIILYPNEDHMAFQQKTSTSGIFIILDPGLAEDFDAMKDGEIISAPAKVGSTPNVIFAVTLPVEDVE